MLHWDRELVVLGLDEIAKCRNDLLVECKRLLDRYHGHEKSTSYYDCIAGDWLESFAHMSYVAMKEVSAYQEVTKPSYRIPIYPDADAYLLSASTEFCLCDHLREIVAELIAGKFITSSWTFSADSTQIISGERQRLAMSALRSVTTKRPDVLLVAPYFKCHRTEVAGTLIRWRRWAALDNLRYPVRVEAAVNKKWRMDQAHNVGLASHHLIDVMRVLLPLHLPVALLEGFAAYRAATLAVRIPQPKVVYSANALHGNLSAKLRIAEWRDEGTQLLYHQHGGGYGIDHALWHEDFEVRTSDRYFTWGWLRSDSPKVRPLSPGALYCPTTTRKFILLSCANYPQSAYRLGFHPMPGTIQIMHRETCEFLAALPRHDSLLVRPYFHDYGWGFEKRMRVAAPEAEFDDRRANALVRYAQSRLVVHNYLGTGYLETLALNIPTVCFYDMSTYFFRPEAQLFIEELERVGVLHRSGKAAACFVAGLGDDPAGWWAKPEVQQVRSNFIKHYANFSPDWKKQWELEFRLACDAAS